MMNFRKYLALFVCLLLTACCFCGCNNDKKEKEELEKSKAQYRAAKMAVYEAENEEYADYEVDVAFLGDSLTDMYDVKTYYPQYLVSNRGIGGDTTFDLENRLQASVYDLKPKVAVMLIGANNFDTMFENYERILMGFDQHLPNTKLILLSLRRICSIAIRFRSCHSWLLSSASCCHKSVPRLRFSAIMLDTRATSFTPQLLPNC